MSASPDITSSKESFFVTNEAIHVYIRLALLLIGFVMSYTLHRAHPLFNVVVTLIGIHTCWMVFVFALLWRTELKLSDNENIKYLRLFVVIDLLIITLYLLTETEIVGFSVLYLFLIVGNGFRFGVRILIETWVGATLSFTIILFIKGYFITLDPVPIGLYISAIILPGYFYRLLKSQSANRANLRSHIKDLKEISKRDNLTGLYNRRSCFPLLQKIIDQAKVDNKKVYVIYIDLDWFKQVNDIFGHVYGDKVIKVIADRLNLYCGSKDILARMGGDEFIFVVNDKTGKFSIKDFSTRLLKEVSQPIFISGKQFRITISIGISVFPDNSSSCDELIDNADLAMYTSKHSGKNQFTLFYTGKVTSKSKIDKSVRDLHSLRYTL